MFDVSIIQTDLYGIAGFRQSLNPDYPVLDVANLTSRSGEYATDNKYVKIEWIKDNQDYGALDDAQFNAELKQLQEASIIRVMHEVFNKPDYIDRQVLYPHAQNRVNSEAMPNGFICHKIEVDIDKNIAFEISRVLLNFSGDGTLELRLFNTSQDAPIESESIVIAAGETHKEVELNWVVDNSGTTYKGDYYIGYRNNTAGFNTLAPFKRDYENSDIKANVTHLTIEDFYFPGHATDTLPDLDAEKSIDEATGLNPDITVYDDFTDLIKQNERLFARAIVLDLQISCIGVYIASLRSNYNQRESKEQIMLLISEIEGVNSDQSTLKITGLRTNLSRAISSIRKQIDKLQKGYLPNRMMTDTLE